jgi:predicted RecB family nuclease
MRKPDAMKDEIRIPTLSKSRYVAGCQCPRRLWQRCHTPELAAARGPAQMWRLEAGHEIGHRAHALFPGGVLVDEDPSRHREAVERTRTLLADANVPAIFQAAFTHAGVRIRVDILERLADGAWGLREVKSAGSVKEPHLHDVAVQRFVLEGSGLRVPSVEVIHVNAGYVRGAGEIDWLRFFHRHDVTAAIEPLRADIPARVQFLHAVLALAETPAIEPSPHCPSGCEFWSHCTRDKPADWIFYLRSHPKRFAEFQAAGIERIVDIPDDFRLSGKQARVRDVLRAGREFVSADLGAGLAAAGPPACYLDFETMGPAVPLYPGTRPYQSVPFQWSLHRLDGAAVLTHREFLADGLVDPRRELVATLLEALDAGAEPILVYSNFEAGVLDELALAVPERAGALARLRARLVDLLPIVRRHVYHPAFGGSFSLKIVAPALVPNFGYGDLESVAGGDEASHAFIDLAQRLAQGDVSEADEVRVRSALLTYCERDTLALVELHRALRERAGAAPA